MTQLPTKTLLNDAAIQAFPRLTHGRATVRDAQISQLVLLVGPQARSWYLHATLRRKTHRVRLGPWPIVGTAQARDMCLETLRRLYKGELVKSVAPMTAPTLATVLVEYLAARKLSAQASADIRSIVGKHAGEWKDRPIDGISARTVATHYRVIATDKPAQANRLLGALSALTKFAHAAHGVGDGGLIQRVRALLGGTDDVAARDVVIPDELQAKWARALAGESAQVARYFKALVLTGLRANELRKLPLSGWDSSARVINIVTTKNGKPHMVCAGESLAALLDAEAAHVADGKVIFAIPVKVYRAACERVGVAIGLDWHLHDLRRTFATVATRAGIDAGMVKRLMNHSTAGDVTAHHYIKLHVEDMRASMRTIEARLIAMWQAA